MRKLVVTFCVSAALAAASPVWAQSYPPNFTGTDFNQATGMTNPTCMEFAPDGRLFVSLQNGALRVFSSTGVSLGTFMTVSVDAPGGGERGLLGIAFDPSFASNHFIYIYRTVTSSPLQNNTHNIVSRFTEDTGTPNRVLAGSEVVILDLDPLSGATNHNGGSIHFSTDGKLYVSVGENANSANAQVVTNRLGKILRINTDGSVPAGNPTTLPTTGGNVTPAGVNRAIWAMGFRNPFTFAVQPGTGRILINDVGQGTREEIDDLLVGRNYGWPDNEGMLGTTNAAYTRPLIDYDHGGSPGGCAITGGTFYNPGTAMFPAAYVGKYFFQDYCGGWIRVLDLSTNTDAAFASGITSPVDLKVDSAGALYCLAGANSGSGKVIRITYSAPGVDQPTVAAFTTPASGATVSGAAVAVNVTAHDADIGTNDGDGIQSVLFELLQGATVLTNPPSHQENTATYDWTFDSTGLTNGTYTIRATVTSTAAAGGTSVVITRNITVSNAGGNTAPVPTIVTPAAGSMYNAGQTISFSGTATDTQDGTLPASAFTWRVDFQHATHAHPFMANTSNTMSGSFTIPTVGETASNVWYRIYLTVTDSGALSTTITRDIMPNLANITLQTAPSGLNVRLDGIPQTTPATITSVVGIQRSIGEMTGQTSGPNTYVFQSWSDAGAATHTISTPAANTTYTLTYVAVTVSSAIVAGCGTTGLEALLVLGMAALLRRRKR